MAVIKNSYPIIGMHCASCAKLIERKISKIPGVINSTVNYANETAYVESNKNLDAEIKSSVEDLGYKVEQNTEEKKLKSQNALKLKVIISGIAALLLMFFPMELF